MSLRLACRVLLKRPAFTVLAVLTLALGIGANTAIFSVVNGVLLRPLPYPQPEQIVGLWEHTARSPRVAVSYPNYRDWHDRLKSFDGVAAYAGGTTTVLGGVQPAFADVYLVTQDFFKVFRVAPALGRTFTPDESAPGGPGAAVVSDRFWRRTLEANPDLAGLHVETNGVSARVVGVMPPGFGFPVAADIWMPQEHWPDDSGRTGHNYEVVARLNASSDHATAELRLVAGQVLSEHPQDDDAQSITMLPLQEALTGASKTVLLLLLAAVALVLLIACANVASTMLARAEERRSEIAVRTALGASRARIVRQLLLESLLLGILGAGAGLVLGYWLLQAFLALNTVPLAGQRVALDGWVLMFTAGLGVLTPLLFGVLPALQVSRPNLRETIAEGSRGSLTLGRRAIRNLLVAAEAGVALVLLVASALLIHSFWKLLAVDGGFDPHGVASMQLVVPKSKYPVPEAGAAFYQALLARIRAIPGVASAGATNVAPLAGWALSGGFVFEGGTAGLNEGRLVADYFVVSPDYFSTMRIPIVQGRAFRESDKAGDEVVVVVNQEFVHRFLADQDPIGRRFRYLGMDSSNEPVMRIIGVVGNVRSDSLAKPVAPGAYVSYLQRPTRTRGFMTVAVRAKQPGAVAALLPTLRKTVASADPDVPIKIGTMEDRVAASIADRRFTMAVLSTFALVALLLAAVGIYSVLSQSVAQRTPEIGVRMALGADARRVLALVIMAAMRPVLLGVAVGVIGSVGSVRLLESFLFGVTPLDPVAFVGAAAILVGVALVAAFVPARRATRIDPLLALRAQ